MDSPGLIGTQLWGTEMLWPAPRVTIGAIFDAPPWSRPTQDNPYVEPDAEYEFSGATGWSGGGSFSGAPGWVGGDPEVSGWTPGDPDDPRDGGTYTVFISGGTLSYPLMAAVREFFPIEVYDADGLLLSRVTQQIGGTLKRQLNKADTLKFSVPATSEGASDLVRPNTVWLRDRWGFVVGTFEIQRRSKRGSGDASYFDIECQSVIAKLGYEALLRYEGTTTTAQGHVYALMAEQGNAAPLTIGTIDAEIGSVSLPFVANDTNILAALLRLQATMPRAKRGYLYVDPQFRLQWRMEIGDQTEQVITRQSNVASISAEIAYDKMANRIYLYGEGQDPDTRLTLVDAGEANEYIQDATSITTYGLQELRKQDRKIKDAATLLLAAQRLLAEFKDPVSTVSVELLDIAKADNAAAGWADINIGGNYRVVDTDLDIDESIEIVSIETELSNPIPIRVDLTNQTPEMSDLVGAILDGQYQPLDVLGNRYPNMGRNLSDGAEPDDLRAGDVRWNNTDEVFEAYDGDAWVVVGSGFTPYLATSKAGLDNTDIEAYALGFITAGTDIGAWYERNAANDGWQGRTIWEAP